MEYIFPQVRIVFTLGIIRLIKSVVDSW